MQMFWGCVVFDASVKKASCKQNNQDNHHSLAHHQQSANNKASRMQVQI
jgi:hypothetical protein